MFCPSLVLASFEKPARSGCLGGWMHEKAREFGSPKTLGLEKWPGKNDDTREFGMYVTCENSDGPCLQSRAQAGEGCLLDRHHDGQTRLLLSGTSTRSKVFRDRMPTFLPTRQTQRILSGTTRGRACSRSRITFANEWKRSMRFTSNTFAYLLSADIDPHRTKVYLKQILKQVAAG